MGHVYFSYAAADIDAAHGARDYLIENGVGVVGEGDERRGASQLPESAARDIRTAHAMVLFLSELAFGAPHLRAEVEEALQASTPIVPVTLDGAKAPAWWEERVGELIHVDGLNDSQFMHEALWRALERFSDTLAPVVAVMNLKGGVGKTTVSTQVFAALQKRRGIRVLMVDLDPQHNLSQVFFHRSTQDTLVFMDSSVISLFEPSTLHDHPTPTEDWRTVNRAIINPASPDEVARRVLTKDETGRLDVICGQFDISKYSFLEHRDDMETARRNFENAIQLMRTQYDVIILDTNPAASFLTKCAMSVATRILAPTRVDRFSLRGVRLLNELLSRLVEDAGRPPISILVNGVERSVVAQLETDMRTGKFDRQSGFAVSRAMMNTRLPTSKFLTIQEEAADDDPLQNLAIYRAGGIWGGALKSSLFEIADEVAALLRMPPMKSAGR